MCESAEDLFPADPVVGEVDRFGWPGVGLRAGQCGQPGWRGEVASGARASLLGASRSRPWFEAAVSFSAADPV